MRKDMKRFLLGFAGFLGCICFWGCNSGSNNNSELDLSRENDAFSVSTDDFIYASTDEVRIPPEKVGKSIYLITYNNSYPNTKHVVDKYNFKGKKCYIETPESTDKENNSKKYSIRNLNSNNYPLSKKVSRNANETSEPNYDEISVNDTVNIYVTETDDTLDENGYWKDSGWKTRTAVKKCEGSFCNVWYIEDPSKPFIALSDSHFSSLAEKFDSIYDKEIKIFGSNIPRAYYRNTISNVACKRRVNIVVYDIGLNSNEEETGGTFGYFHDKDFFVRTASYRGDFVCGFSNLGEFIYVDSYFLSKYTEQIYSTLAHEFQHLLFFVNKDLNYNMQVYTWNTEMMSMLAEEILQSDLGVNDIDSPKSRFRYFKTGSFYGFTDKVWDTFDDGTFEYANTYAFGSYLLHKFGVSYIKKMVSNAYSGTAMITESLPEGETFNTLLYKFAKSYIDGYYQEINEGAFLIPGIDLLDSKWTMTEEWVRNFYKESDSFFKSYNPVINSGYYMAPVYPQGFYVMNLGTVGEEGAIFSSLKHSDSNVFRFIYLKEVSNE